MTTPIITPDNAEQVAKDLEKQQLLRDAETVDTPGLAKTLRDLANRL